MVSLGEIQEAANRFEAAFLEGSSEAAASLMTEDAVASPIGGPDIIGNSAILQFFQNVFEAMTISVYKTTVSEVEVYGDVAYDRGTFVWESVLKDETLVHSVGRYAAVRHRGPDGVWRLHRLIENQAPE